tara:strand:- start:2353 stop:2544 length:192 start_codon:yes stop_codon:yes gene_type:complete
MDDVNIKKRMAELGRPIDEAIMHCDSREEILMLGSLMMIAVKNLFDAQIGKEGRKTVFMDFAK